MKKVLSEQELKRYIYKQVLAEINNQKHIELDSRILDGCRKHLDTRTKLTEGFSIKSVSDYFISIIKKHIEKISHFITTKCGISLGHLVVSDTTNKTKDFCIACIGFFNLCIVEKIGEVIGGTALKAVVQLFKTRVLNFKNAFLASIPKLMKIFNIIKGGIRACISSIKALATEGLSLIWDIFGSAILGVAVGIIVSQVPIFAACFDEIRKTLGNFIWYVTKFIVTCSGLYLEDFDKYIDKGLHHDFGHASSDQNKYGLNGIVATRQDTTNPQQYAYNKPQPITYRQQPTQYRK